MFTLKKVFLLTEERNETIVEELLHLSRFFDSKNLLNVMNE